VTPCRHPADLVDESYRCQVCGEHVCDWCDGTTQNTHGRCDLHVDEDGFYEPEPYDDWEAA
jgi:hypothetical protein